MQVEAAFQRWLSRFTVRIGHVTWREQASALTAGVVQSVEDYQGAVGSIRLHCAGVVVRQLLSMLADYDRAQLVAGYARHDLVRGR